MFNENPKNLCRVYRNPSPARFTGNHLCWICVTPDGKTYCDTRETARDIAREYRAERQKLVRQYLQTQGRIELYDGNETTIDPKDPNK